MPFKENQKKSPFLELYIAFYPDMSVKRCESDNMDKPKPPSSRSTTLHPQQEQTTANVCNDKIKRITNLVKLSR